jgi:hypothetical protein
MTQLDTGNFTSLNLSSIRKAGVYCNVLAATSGNRSDFKTYSSGTTARAFGDTTPASKQKFFKAVKKLNSLGLLTKKGKNYISLAYDKEEEFAQIPNDLISLPQEILRFYACLVWAWKTGKKVNKYVLNQKVGLQFKKGKSLEALIAEFSAQEKIHNRVELLTVLDKEAPTRFDAVKKEKVEAPKKLRRIEKFEGELPANVDRESVEGILMYMDHKNPYPFDAKRELMYQMHKLGRPVTQEMEIELIDAANWLTGKMNEEKALKKEKAETLLPKTKRLTLVKNDVENKLKEVPDTQPPEEDWIKKHKEEDDRRQYDGVRVDRQSVLTLEEFVKEQEEWAIHCFNQRYQRRELSVAEIVADIQAYWAIDTYWQQRPTEFFWKKIDSLASSTKESSIYLKHEENSSVSFG